MWPFKKEPFEPSPTAKTAREEAIKNDEAADRQLAEARSLGNRLAEIRSRNHFAESLTNVFGGTRHGH